MSEPRLLIHIGYPKCASTWLQETLFKETSGFLAAWAGSRSPIWGTPAREASKLFIIPDESSFSIESTSKFFEAGFEKAFSQGLVPVLSHEQLINTPTGSGDWEKKVPKRLYSVFPNARILIVIREQKSMIMSAYRHYILTGGTETIDGFISPKKKSLKEESIFAINYIKYDSLIELYQNLFGVKNVLVLPMEILKKSPHFFTQRIVDFAGVNGSIDYSTGAKNIGYKAGRLAIQRILNLFSQPNKQGNSQQAVSWLVACKIGTELEKIMPQTLHESLEKRYQQLIAETVENLFIQSNQRTSQLIEMNLAEFGYDC